MNSIDKTYVRSRFLEASASYDQHASAQKQIASQLVSLLEKHLVSAPTNVWEFGCGSGILTRLFLQKYEPAHYYLNDLYPVEGFVRQLLKNSNYHFSEGDAENMVFNHQFDLILSSSTIQWFHDPESFINKCSTHLKPGSLIALSSFSPENMREIKKLTGVGLTYPTVSDLKKWLKNDYELLEMTTNEIVLHFINPAEILKHLQATGVNGIRPYKWTPDSYRYFCK
ncbi:MAG: malonyl-ACP O-methyltransferase BioC, partial [Bacteroidales bacterium]